MIARLFAPVLLVWLPLATLAEPRPVLDWLSYDEDVRDAYDIAGDATDPARALALPKAAPEKRVLLLLPSRSQVAYSLAVNAMLRQFQDAAIHARFDIWYYNRNEDIAREALDWAYAAPVDLIVSVGSSATSYLTEHHQGHSIPAVTSASKDPVSSGHLADAVRGSGTNIAYTSISVSTETLVAYLRKLLPELNTIGVLYARSNQSAVLTQVEPLREAADRLDFNLVDIAVDSKATAASDLDARLPAGIAEMDVLDPGLANSLLLITGSTSVYERIGQINSYAGTLPVISMLPDVVQEGQASALMSIGVNLSSAVKLAASYAVRVITGEADPGTLPVGVVTPPDLSINFAIAEKVGLDVPFSFLESSTFIYDLAGQTVVAFGQSLHQP